MEIKDFIKEALLQIVDGVSTANEALQDKGAFIPTKGLIGEGVLFRVEGDVNIFRKVVVVLIGRP